MHRGRGSTANLITVCAYACSMTPYIIYMRCYSSQQSTLWFCSQRTPQLVEGENPINFTPVDTPVGGIVWHQMRQPNTWSMWAVRCWSIYHSARLNDDAWSHYTCRRPDWLFHRRVNRCHKPVGMWPHTSQAVMKMKGWEVNGGHCSCCMLSSIFFLPQLGSNLTVFFTKLYWQYIKMLKNHISFA